MVWNPEDFASPEVKAEIRRLDTAVTPGSAELLALADDCERYAKIIEGIIVVPDDYRDGDGTERREPRATLLKAAVALRLAAKPAEEDIARIKVQRDNALLDMERFMNEAQSAREATIEECAMNHLSRSGFTLRDNEAVEYLTDAVATTAALSAPVPPADRIQELRKEAYALAYKINLGADRGPDGFKIRHRTVEILRALAVLPSPAIAAEPVAWRTKNDFGEWGFSEDPLWDTSEPLYATPPVRGDRATYAQAICEADGYDYNGERARAQNGSASAREIIDRAHRYAAAILSLPVQPGAGEREADAEIARNYWRTSDSKPIRKDYECLIGGKIADAILSRQAPHSSSEGGR